MLALRFKDNHLDIENIDVPDAAGEALVKVTVSGICNTDLEIARGYAGFQGTLGHEFVGVVERAQDPAWLGKRVVGEINAGCGRCNLCISGDPRHCPSRTVLGIVGRDGAHAEFLTLPEVNLLEVPSTIPDEEAVFIEPLAAAWGITDKIQVHDNMRLAVIGDGKLGQLCAAALRAAGASVILVGKHESKLEIAKRRGIETVLKDDTGDIRNTFDVVVEASGSESGFGLALDLLHPGGVLVLKSTFQGNARIDAARIVVNEISVVGSRCGRFAPAIELLKNRAVSVSDLISDIYNLSDGVQAMDRAQQNGVMKVLLKP